MNYIQPTILNKLKKAENSILDALFHMPPLRHALCAASILFVAAGGTFLLLITPLFLLGMNIHTWIGGGIGTGLGIALVNGTHTYFVRKRSKALRNTN